VILWAEEQRSAAEEGGGAAFDALIGIILGHSPVLQAVQAKMQSSETASGEAMTQRREGSGADVKTFRWASMTAGWFEDIWYRWEMTGGCTV